MLKKILLGVGLLLVALVGFIVYSNLFPKSPPTTKSFSENGLDINVAFGQPSKRGRLIFGEEKDGALQPYGKYWRLGANAATEITFNKDISFAGKPVKAGSYRMYAVPGAESFQISLNSEVGVFFGVQEPDYSKDVLKVDVPVIQSPTETEQFTINFTSDSTAVNMDFVWDKVIVRVPISVQ
ncbi:MAG: DUF2911 domain-containing protein [Cytophagales bacterium]|jgi:hypothetical protein|nr:DUF2911 domain-containing protein [Cytophagales bacterium]MCA6388019.1 DUF2911 domain-containing protein [Cytophagales bacterium]MCA6391048.1 DUF2911 domain-containing protein [Cytophagales bacterium]MCA6395187.1 DUF2911 domain-containing protein [Cytophagales bacterium]MCA6398843.1 DUF2911 domain-containing protein [Cytophagales bacterium]